MLAFRTTWYVKQGKMARALEILMAEGQRLGEMRKAKGINKPVEGHLLSPLFSPDALVMEMLFESVADHDAYWATYDPSDEAGQAFWKEWNELIDHRGGQEVWQVHTP